MISEGQRNDINYAIPLLDQIEINGSNVLADRGYDSNKLLDYVYARSGEPTIPSRKGAKFERHCDWWLYKERHLVEKYFLKLMVNYAFMQKRLMKTMIIFLPPLLNMLFQKKIIFIMMELNIQISY